MSKRLSPSIPFVGAAVALFVAALAPSAVLAQAFDFARLEEKVRSFSVIIDMDIEISFGVHSSEQTDRYLGTIVTDSGLVMFDGSSVGSDVAAFSGFSVSTEPTKVAVTTMDGKTYPGEYIGFDRFSGIGFLQIKADGETFTPVQFRQDHTFRVGEWLGLNMLLPEFVTPPLAADVGMVSALVTSPERFALTVGFSSMQAASVLFDENLEAVGVLGVLANPSEPSESAAMMGSFGQMGMPLLGVIGADRLATLIANPPKKGVSDRGWLGITLQALTKDMAEFWDLDVEGGIIINDVVGSSPAAEAGLEVSDIIIEVNGQPVAVDKEEKLPLFQRMISDLGPGASVELGVLRRSQTEADTLRMLVTLTETPIAAADAEELEVREFEFKVRNLVFADYMITNQDPDEFDGVVVADIEMGGVADISGLQIGDIIQRLGSTDIMSVEDLQTVMQSLKAERPREVILFVWRGGKTMFVNLKTNWAQR